MKLQFTPLHCIVLHCIMESRLRNEIWKVSKQYVTHGQEQAYIKHYSYLKSLQESYQQLLGYML